MMIGSALARSRAYVRARANSNRVSTRSALKLSCRADDVAPNSFHRIRRTPEREYLFSITDQPIPVSAADWPRGRRCDARNWRLTEQARVSVAWAMRGACAPPPGRCSVPLHSEWMHQVVPTLPSTRRERICCRAARSTPHQLVPERAADGPRSTPSSPV